MSQGEKAVRQVSNYRDDASGQILVKSSLGSLSELRDDEARRRKEERGQEEERKKEVGPIFTAELLPLKWQVHYSERVAIREFHGNQDRVAAELCALVETIHAWKRLKE